jgi:sulfotransferase family protein
MSLIIVIGRGHSGTRAISHTLSASGVFMGDPLNESGDLLPPEAMYDAASLFGPCVRHTGHLTWDFSRAIGQGVPAEFESLVRQYLTSVLAHDGPHRGWKIPETTLALPWIVRMFPEAKYIYWVRDPRDCILKDHVTDDLARFGVDYPPTDDVYRCRAISWKYQYELIEATPRPKHWTQVRFEDFVLDQQATLDRLGEFLQMPLARVPVRPEAVGRYRQDAQARSYGFLTPLMQRYGYDISDHAFANEVN